jgi:glycosyltransferase involved in cell wall biosynthesis
MRILAIGNMYPPHHQGGYEVVWQAAMHAAREAGHTVRILTTDHREPGERPQEDPDVYRTLRWYWDWQAYEFPQLGPVARVRLERANARELRRHLTGFAPDLVSWWAMGSMSLSLIEQVRRRGLPAVFAVHDDWLGYGRAADRWTRMWHGRRLALAPLAERLLGLPTRVDVAAAGTLVFNSRFIRDRAAAAGVDVSRSEVVYPGIDERFLDPQPPRPWRWRLLYAGRLDRQKGVDTAVAALAHLPDEATLTIAGTGDAAYAAALRAAAGERLRFTGFLGPDGLRDVYADADAVLFPVRWEEPFGLVPLEAMGLGRPVVSTARGGSAEFLADGENALLVEPDDPAALADRLRRLAGDPALRERLRAGGLHTAQRHTLGGFARRMVEILEAAA